MQFCLVDSSSTIDTTDLSNIAYNRFPSHRSTSCCTDLSKLALNYVAFSDPLDQSDLKCP